MQRMAKNEENKNGEPELSDFQIKLDRFLVDPNACSADKSYQNPDLKLIMAFSEVPDDDFNEDPEALMEW